MCVKNRAHVYVFLNDILWYVLSQVMIDGSRILAIIPARGGSKGLPGKNILKCGAKPLIAWTIEASLGTPLIDHTHVSTDDTKIADVALMNGANIDFMRPAGLALDESSLLDVVRYTLDRLEDEFSHSFDYVVVLQPTSPLRDKVVLESAIRFFFKSKISDRDTLVSVYEVPNKFGWLLAHKNASNNDIYVGFCIENDRLNPHRQALGRLYMPNGAVFIAPVKYINDGFYGENTIPFVMDKNISIDIDSESDFIEAEKLLIGT